MSHTDLSEVYLFVNTFSPHRFYHFKSFEELKANILNIKLILSIYISIYGFYSSEVYSRSIIFKISETREKIYLMQTVYQSTKNIRSAVRTWNLSDRCILVQPLGCAGTVLKHELKGYLNKIKVNICSLDVVCFVIYRFM